MSTSDDTGAIDRRALLIGAGLGVVSVVGGVLIADSVGFIDLPLLDRGPDDGLRRVSAADEVRLIDTYDTVLSDASISDASRSRAQLFRDHHAAHLSALGGPPRSEPDESALPPLPQGQSASAGYLADLERSATRVRRDACTTATDPELVRVLALICSSEDLHARAWSGGPA